MEWLILIMPIIVTMIQSCNKSQNVSEIQDAALNRPVGRVMIRWALRKEGFRGGKLREAMKEVRDYDMSDDDVKDFVLDALS